MSEAPERIWAWEYKGNSPWGPVKPNLDIVKNGAEYIRADHVDALVAAADALAAWAKAISERKASPATGGRLVLERDLVGLETARARLFRLMDDLEWAYPEAMAEVNAMHPCESGEQSE